MLARLSVHKPYTVLVAVIAILVLGVVSFMNMTTDLLPSIDLPYAVVITSYAGASPEQVETVVTRPAEQALATLSNLENISSISRENLSIVILQFFQGTNMDTATIDMRESLDMISSYWDDSISTPTLLKLNPDMLPVMVTSVDMADKSITEISKYVQDVRYNFKLRIEN